ncbi:MAG: hypothetical protein ACR2IH_01355 [Pyrinomonadaceae bacterium]
MGLGDRVDDWQACCVMQAGAAASVAAGLFIIDFYSSTASVSGRFTFKGVGAGVGGNASGTALPANIGPFGPWSSLDCDKSFSIWDLNGGWGRISTLGVGVGVQFGVAYITAAPRWSWSHAYFHSQNIGGFGTGLGAGGMALIGSWSFKHVTNNEPSGGDDSYAA